MFGIPRACGGRVALPFLRGAVHPRACGGSPTIHCSRFPSPGPSPRVRGKHGVTGSRGPTTRSIPAVRGKPPPQNSVYSTGPSPRVRGKPNNSLLQVSHLRVHPRACGGKRRSNLRFTSRRGSIPARAGETKTPFNGAVRTSVHPRACGGNSYRLTHQIYPFFFRP